LGKGKTSFHEKRGRNVGFGIFSPPLSAVALCKGGNPFQEKRGIFKVKDSTLSAISTCIGNRAFHNITLKGEKVNTGNIKTMVMQIKNLMKMYMYIALLFFV
jgi:hypothetical protein